MLNESDKNAAAMNCYTEYWVKFNRAPTVKELWDWLADEEEQW